MRVKAVHPSPINGPQQFAMNGVLPGERAATRFITKPDMISSSINLIISHSAYLVLWCFVFLVSFLSGVFLLATAYMYLAKNDGSGYAMLAYLRDVFLYQEASAFLQDNSKVIGVGYLLPALPFWCCCFYLTWHSIRAGRLSFGARRRSDVDVGTKRKSLWRVTQRWKCLKTSFLVVQINQLIQRLKPFGIRGMYFKHVLLVMESIEITLQTIQAYRYSKSISNRFVNAWCGGVILMNCSSGPVISFIAECLGQNVLMERLLCVLADQLLDFLWGPAFQLYLLWPYMRLFHDWTTNLDALSTFDKTTETAERELMQIFDTSWLNYCFNIFPFITSANVLYRLCGLLEEAEREWLTFRAIAVQRVDTAHNPRAKSRSCTHRTMRVFEAMLVVYGFAILVISLTAARYVYPTEERLVLCQNCVYPWFVNKESCVGHQINCTASGMVGHRDEITAAIDTIDPSLVVKLEFCDCPELEIPPEITQFHAVGTLRLINVTLRSWEADAAISNSAFPLLKTLQIRYSTISCIPSGIFHDHLPDAFEWIAIHGLNADTFMHLVGDAWSNVVYFYCVDCGLSSVPEITKSMFQLREVVLDSNFITNVDVEHLGGNSTLVDLLSLDYNPITSLPDDV